MGGHFGDPCSSVRDGRVVGARHLPSRLVENTEIQATPRQLRTQDHGNTLPCLQFQRENHFIARVDTRDPGIEYIHGNRVRGQSCIVQSHDFTSIHKLRPDLYGGYMLQQGIPRP